MLKYSLDEIVNHPAIKKIIEEHNISKSIIEENILKLNLFLNNFHECLEEGPLSECKQPLKGYESYLEYSEGIFYQKIRECKHWYFENKNHKILTNFIYADYDISNEKETIKEYFNSLQKEEKENHKDLFLKIKELTQSTTYQKGIFLWGNSGCGKTYLMKKLANYYANKDKKVAFVTLATLIRIFKEAISSNDSSEKQMLNNKCLEADVLFLDDIGVEMISEWFRDEVLFTILNYRYENNKLTFFTSNFSLKELDKMYTNKKITDPEERKIDKKKTLRFTDRIKGLANELKMTGDSRRYSK